MTHLQHSNGVTTRPATTADRHRCLSLIESLTGQAIEPGWAVTFDELCNPTDGVGRGSVVVAERDGEILGCATVSYNLAIRYSGEYCQLEELIVDPAARGLSLGRILVQRTIDDARARGCAEIGLYLVPTTEGNRPFYEKLGFELVGSELRQRLDGGRLGES